MNEKKVAIINGIITGILGGILLNLSVYLIPIPLLGGTYEITFRNYIAHAITILIIPLAIFGTKLFFKLKSYSNYFVAFILGTMFASVNGAIVITLAIIILGKYYMLVSLPMLLVPIGIFSTFVGGISGLVITAIHREQCHS